MHESTVNVDIQLVAQMPTTLHTIHLYNITIDFELFLNKLSFPKYKHVPIYLGISVIHERKMALNLCLINGQDNLTPFMTMYHLYLLN